MPEREEGLDTRTTAMLDSVLDATKNAVSSEQAGEVPSETPSPDTARRGRSSPAGSNPSLQFAPNSKTNRPSSDVGCVPIPYCPFFKGRKGRSEALTAHLGTRIRYSAHEDDGVEGGFPDEKQEGPVGFKDNSVHGEGAAGDKDSCGC